MLEDERENIQRRSCRLHGVFVDQNTTLELTSIWKKKEHDIEHQKTIEIVI